MAISGGDMRVSNDSRQSFATNVKDRGSAVESTIGNYSSSNTKTGGFWGWGDYDNSQNSHDMVGITPEMLNTITGAIDDYIGGLNNILDGMPTAVNYAQAFKGTGVEQAVQNFVTAVKDLCKSYLNNLKEAENQIVEAVHSSYESSDENLSSQLNSDTGAISS